MYYNILFRKHHMEDIFGSVKDEFGNDFKDVYKYELEEISNTIENIIDNYSKFELAVILHFLMSECFGDSISSDSEVYLNILKDYYMLYRE